MAKRKHHRNRKSINLEQALGDKRLGEHTPQTSRCLKQLIAPTHWQDRQRGRRSTEAWGPGRVPAPASPPL